MLFSYTCNFCVSLRLLVTCIMTHTHTYTYTHTLAHTYTHTQRYKHNCTFFKFVKMFFLFHHFLFKVQKIQPSKTLHQLDRLVMHFLFHLLFHFVINFLCRPTYRCILFLWCLPTYLLGVDYGGLK